MTDSAANLQRVFDSADGLLLLDRARLRQQARAIQQRLQRRQPADRMLRSFEAELSRAEQRYKRRTGFQPELHFPNELPISAHREKIAAALAAHQVVIVSGDTGSGKTTQLPKIALAAGRGRLGRIGCTQPRRLAAVSMARRVAEELHGQLGRAVGYQVRFDDQISDETIIKFMTDGILLAETASDRSLWQYDTLIIDEAHERSLNIDFILGYVKTLLPRRPDLKVIVSSATLDVEGFAQFFDSAPVLTIEGRMFPIEDVFLPPHDDDVDVARQVARAVHWVHELDPRGDMLVFLPGEREIRDAAELLRGKQYAATEILPLFARLTLADQQRVFTTGSRRRIVLATNVAETSITIPGIHYVIDSGLVRINRYQPRRHIQSLQIEQVSQASARQRRGRCGRVADGLCVHLYSEETLALSPAFTDPEIRRASLAGVILQMAVLGLPAIDEFPFVNPPPRPLVAEGYQTLFEIGALDERKNLTPLGRELAAFPVDPQIARMIVQARTEHVVPELLVLAALLSIQDPRERPAEQQTAADAAHRQWQDERSDFHAALRLWNAWQTQRRSKTKSNSQIRRWCKTNFVSYRRMLEWQNLFRELAETVEWRATLRRGRDSATDATKRVPPNVAAAANGPHWPGKIPETVHDDCFYDRILRSVLAGIPLHVGRRDENSEYQGTRDRRFFIFPGSGLFKSSPPWVVAFTLVETLKLYGRTVAAIQPEWLEQVAPHLCTTSHAEIAWDAEQGFVYARESVSCGGLTIISGRRVHYGRIKPDVAREVFLREALVPGNLRSRGAWLSPHRQMLETIHNLEHKIRRPESLLNREAIFVHFNKLVPADVCSTKDFDRWLQRDQPTLAMSLDEATYPTLESVAGKVSRTGDACVAPTTASGPTANDFPDELTFRGHKFALRYRFAPGEADDGMVLRCPERLLSMLPAFAADWLVPGWLPEKVRLLIRSVPKEQRAVINPLQAVVDDFLQTTTREQPLVRALTDYLHRRFQINAEFDATRLPEHLVMKIAVLDERGNVRELLREKPGEVAEAVQVDRASAWMPPGLYRTGLTRWPEPARLPGPLRLSETVTGYPALVDEGATVGVRLFLDAATAAAEHATGVVRLFRLEHATEVAALERRLPLPTLVQAALSTLPGETHSALDDFVDFVIEKNVDPTNFQPRAALADVAADQAANLATILQARDAVLTKLNEFRKHAVAIADIEQQLSFLFRPGFLHGEEIWQRYPRYLQAIGVRLDRLAVDPTKDRSKFEAVRPFQELLDKKIAALPRRRLPADVLRFATLLQEFRISQFAPELGTFERVSPKILQAASEFAQ